jgi:hypothetical protein
METNFHDPIAPGAALQLTALVATLAGALGLAALVVAWSWWRRRRHATPPPAAPQESPPRSAAGPVLPGAALIVVLVLPAAVAVRQLWPQPDLGVRLLIGWLALVVPSVLAWVVLAIAANRQGSRP